MHAFTTGDLSPRAFGRVFDAERKGTVDVERVDEARVLGAGDERADKIRSGMEELKVRFFVSGGPWTSADSWIGGRLGTGCMARLRNLASPSRATFHSGTL